MCFQKHVRSVYFFRSTNIFQNCKNYQNSFTTDWGHWFNILHVCPVSQQSMEPRREEGVGWEATAVLRPQPHPTQDIAQTWAWSRDFFEWHIEFVTEPKPKLAMSSCKRLYQPAGGPSHLLLTSLLWTAPGRRSQCQPEWEKCWHKYTNTETNTEIQK